LVWVCLAPENVCLCPSPAEAVKSGALNIIETVQFGITSIDEVANATTNYVDRNISQLKEEIGEGIESLSDISSDLFDRFLQPAIDKLLEWFKFMFETILEGANYILGEITEGIFESSKFIYKEIFKVCLDKATAQEVALNVLDKICEILGTDLDDIENYIENTEPFTKVLKLFKTLNEITETITSIVTAPQRFLEDLANEYIRPFIVDYFGDVLPLEAIPIEGLEDLILNIAVDNLVITPIGQLFGDMTAGMRSAMNNIVDFLINVVGSSLTDDQEGISNIETPGWGLELLGIVLALCSLIVGFLGFHPSFSSEAKGLPGQVGSALSIVGVILGYVNLLSTIENSATSGKFDEELGEHLNGIKTSKDLAISNSTTLVITIAGLLIQIKGGSTTPYEYIIPGVSLIYCLIGFFGAVASNSISGDPILAALVELYDDLDYGEGDESKLTEGAKDKGLVPTSVEDKMEIPGTINITPIIEVQKPWYGPGPELIYYCFTDSAYAKKVAEDFIDDQGNINVWIYTKVRNDSMADTRINMKFYYRVNNGSIQLLYNATQDQDKGDLLKSQSIREYWYQKWQISEDLAKNIIKGNCHIIAKAEVKGNYDSEKSCLEYSTLMKIPPYFMIEPLNIASSGTIETKTYNNTEIPVVMEGDILTFTTKIKNTGGAFANYAQLPIRWYLDDNAGEPKQISKQIYRSPSKEGFGYNEEIEVSLDIKTTNLGLSSFGIKGWMRTFKIALLEQDFGNCIGENIPLFSGPNKEKEKQLRIEFDCWEPDLGLSEITFSNQTPIEGQTVISRCKLENNGNGALNLRKGDLIIKELSFNKSPLGSIEFKHFNKLNLIDTNFDQTPFDNRISEITRECSKLSFDFISPKDMWVDSIELKTLEGARENSPCADLEISYLGYKIAEFDEYDSETGLVYLQNPILMEEGREYHIEINDISGEIMINEGDYYKAGRGVLKNSVITFDDGNHISYHPKIKLWCKKSLPPQSHGVVEHIIETDDKLTTKYIQWAYKSTQLGIEISKEEGIAIQEKKIKAFRLVCEEKKKLMGYVPVVEYTLKLIKEDDVDDVDVKVALKSKSTNINQILPYLKETTIPIEEFTTKLRYKNPKVFIAGVAASKSLKTGYSSTFSVLATAKVEDQEIKQEVDLEFTLTKDISSIFSFTCKKNTHRLQEIYQTDYDLELVNNTPKALNFLINATGESSSEPQNWDYQFFSNKKKRIERELGPGRKDIRFDVVSKTKTEPVEVRNQIIASYSWDPFNQDNRKYSLQKELGLLSIFEEEPHPLAITFRASPNAADPGIPIKLTAQFHIFPSAAQEQYNLYIKQEGNVEFISRPPRSFQLESGKTRYASWEIKIPEDAEIGGKIPVRLISKISRDPREISSIVNLDVTNFRNKYEFSLKSDWRILSVIKGERALLKISVENLGKKTDTINIILKDTLPSGWYLTPNRNQMALSPDNTLAFNVSIHAPQSAKAGEGGIITIVATSKGDSSFKQTKKVTVKAAPPGPKWSVLLKTKKTKRSITLKGSTSFDLTLTNNGNRQLGNVNLKIKHKYQPIQFKTEVIPHTVNLRRIGATKTAKAIIEPRITGPGEYDFDIIGRWEERILYAQDEQRVRVKYSKMSFLKSKYGIITIGLGIGIIIIAIILILIFSNI